MSASNESKLPNSLMTVEELQDAHEIAEQAITHNFNNYDGDEAQEWIVENRLIPDFEAVAKAYLYLHAAEQGEDAPEREWWPVPDDLWHYSAQFRDVRKGGCIQARRVKHSATQIDDSRTSYYKDGDWIVDEASGKPFVLSHEAFCDRYVLIFPPPVSHRHRHGQPKDAPEDDDAKIARLLDEASEAVAAWWTATSGYTDLEESARSFLTDPRHLEGGECVTNQSKDAPHFFEPNERDPSKLAEIERVVREWFEDCDDDATERCAAKVRDVLYPRKVPKKPQYQNTTTIRGPEK